MRWGRDTLLARVVDDVLSQGCDMLRVPSSLCTLAISRKPRQTPESGDGTGLAREDGGTSGDCCHADRKKQNSSRMLMHPKA